MNILTRKEVVCMCVCMYLLQERWRIIICLIYYWYLQIAVFDCVDIITSSFSQKLTL